VVTDIAAYQRRKLWLLNGPHSALAYGGLIAGLDTIADAAADRTVSVFVRRYIDEVVAVVQLPAALDARQFADEALRRFANAQLGDSCLRVAADSSRKFPHRLFPVVRARRRCGLPTRRLAVVAAAWIAAAVGIGVNDRVLPRIDDPAVDNLQEAMSRAGHRHLCDVAVGLETDPTFVDEVHAALHQLSRDGIGALA
jgi:fructuronate reductase